MLDVQQQCIQIAAVGDLLLAGGPDARGDLTAQLGALRPLLAGSDIRFANLECTLAGKEGLVATEPRVISTPAMVRSIAAAGFDVVCLGNNHAFDALADGFHRLRELLAEMRIACFGAGDDLAEATAPLVLERPGGRVAMLAGVDESSGPSHLAGPGRFGVAPLDMDRLTGQIRELRDSVQHVVVSLHWGQERLTIPSPRQVDQARRLADAGADLILGHHPHVVQGMETIGHAAVIYSLGNFVANTVGFSDGDALRWNRRERTGCVLKVRLGTDGVQGLRQIATFDTGRAIRFNGVGHCHRRIVRRNRALNRPITSGRYRRRCFWTHSMLPILRHLQPGALVRLRWRNVRNAWRRVRESLSAG